MRFNRKKIKKTRGISLIEVVVYVALLGIISVFLIRFLLQTLDAYYLAQAERETISNARLLLETLDKNIAESRAVYWPTSRFNESSGQLSLITDSGALPEHESAFVDFWVDNGRLWTRKEGGSDAALSAASVVVSEFRLEWMLQGLGRETVRITLRVDYGGPKYKSSVTFHSSTALRGKY